MARATGTRVLCSNNCRASSARFNSRSVSTRSLTGHPLAHERVEGVWGNREVPHSTKGACVGDRFPPGAEGERRSREKREQALAFGLELVANCFR